MNRSIVILVASVSLFAVGCKKKAPEPAPAPEPVAVAEPAPSKQAQPEHIQKMVANFQRVYFDFDSSTLAEDAKAALAENADIMKKHPDVRVEIQGHADERGTTDYNLALADRRAESVKKHLTLLGVSADRVTTISYGEERPAVVGQNEGAWSKNRRAEFRVTWGDRAPVTGTVE